MKISDFQNYDDAVANPPLLSEVIEYLSEMLKHGDAPVFFYTDDARPHEQLGFYALDQHFGDRI